MHKFGIDSGKFGKYDHLIDIAPYGEIKDPHTTTHLQCFYQWPESGIQFAAQYVTMAYYMDPHMMVHDFDQFTVFINPDTNDMSAPLDAEITFQVGEGEDAVTIDITHTTSIYLPAGTPHGKLNFKRIGKPVMFMDINLTSNYERHVKKDDGSYTENLTVDEYVADFKSKLKD